MTETNEVILTGQRSIEWLKKKGYPYTDILSLKKSQYEFSGGGQYGVELPVINSFEVLKKTINLLQEEGVYCTVFNETLGAHLISDSEISDMLELCRENGYGFVFSTGPRPEYDIKASFYRTEFGLEVGRKLNNNDALRASIEDVFRLVDLGCTGITFYDIGVLRMAKEMRDEGVIPKNIQFKSSSHCMATNPMIAKIFSENGADSTVVLHDLTLPVLQEMRKINPTTVFDVPIDCYKTKGGYIRYNELAEIVQVVAPVMLKMGTSAQSHPQDAIKEDVILKRINRVKLGQEVLDRYLKDKTKISKDSVQCCIPVKPSDVHKKEAETACLV